MEMPKSFVFLACSAATNNRKENQEQNYSDLHPESKDTPIVAPHATQNNVNVASAGSRIFRRRTVRRQK